MTGKNLENHPESKSGKQWSLKGPLHKLRVAWEIARALDHLSEMDKEAIRLLNDEELWAVTYRSVEQRLKSLATDYENTRFLPDFYMMKSRQRAIKAEAARLRQALDKLQEAYLAA